MKILWMVPVIGLCWGCSRSGEPAAAGADAPQVAEDASSYAAHGMSVSRPSGQWVFIPPDESVAPDTVVILQGPVGDATLAPAVEISRRKLNAQQRRRKASHVLTATATEIVQLFAGFEMVGGPEDVKLGDQSAAKIEMKFDETLPDGGTASRYGIFYGIMHQGDMWLVRCVGTPGDSSRSDFEAIVQSMSFEG